MCKCYLSQICFCILIFCKELGLCCMTNLNSNSGSAFSLLRDLDPNITSLWASVSLTLYRLPISICLCLSLSIYLCLHICMNIYIYIHMYTCIKIKDAIFPLIPLKWDLCIWIIHIWQSIILLTGSAAILNVHSVHCYSKCGPKIRAAY